MRGAERGQATVEWSSLLLVVAVLLGSIALVVARADAWRLGDSILHSIACAAGADCEQADALERAYGGETAELVRRYSPNVTYERDSAELPIDFRRCRRLECANGADAAEQIRSSMAGLPVTAFTRVVDRRAAGGALYLQYWFYYPESFSGALGRLLGPFTHDWPGYHPDDWEGVQLMLRPNAPVVARATAHGGYSSGWTRWTGWYRVSGGSHAGQLVDRTDGERTTPAAGLALIPLERQQDLQAYRFAISPPWLKEVYEDPESASS
jgi:hypothetical protein